MKTANSEVDNISPFHDGEKLLQEKTGKREQMESFGRRAIRSFMPQQHQEFYNQLPFLVVGSVDEEGWPWASIVSGRPGFANATDLQTLQVNALPSDGDPLKNSIKSGKPMGLLGIETTTRRRNRLNGHISKVEKTGFTLDVDQSFGNCPQYIQTRTINYIREPNSPVTPNLIKKFTNLDKAAKDLISNSDSFYVSSYIPTKDRPQIEGVDVSHRGGKPGFVRVEEDTLTVPDFRGNNHFNTLGNFLVNPKAGLVFTDFSSGDLLLLTGAVELVSEIDPEIVAFKGAERGWRFTLDHGLMLKDALPFRFNFEEYSPNTLLTGGWLQTDETC